MFAEERDDVPQEPEGSTPEEGAPEEQAPGALPGEPGEAAPAGDEAEAGEGAAPEGEGAASEGEGPEGDEAESDAAASDVGPEIGGAEDLAAAGEAAEEREAADSSEVADQGEAGGGEPTAEGEAAGEGEATGEDEAAAVGEAADQGEVAAEGEAPAEGEAAAEGEDGAPSEAPRERGPRRDRRGRGDSEEEVIPGMHLEPDLVLDEQAREESEFGEYGEVEDYVEPEGAEAAAAEAPPEPAELAPTPLDLAADARYHATGKRKSAVARVILRPGEGTYDVNGRHLDEYFPRVRLQRLARQPLEATGNNSRMDVVARIHGGGVAAQANALRHGIARALVEADPALRTELKRRGYLTRDPRVKERKKAGLKKARKRPQFSKR